MLTRIVFLAFSVVCLFVVSCTSATSSLSTIPTVAPIVDAAAPTALKAASTRLAKIAPHSGGRTSLATELQTIFKGTYEKLSGGTAVGYINALLEDLDGRMTELKTRFTGSSPSCMAATSSAFTLDASFVDAAFSEALDVQCKDAFSGTGGDISYAGSGLVFGKDASENYSLWLGLNHDASSGFGYGAKVTNPTSDADKQVDLLFIEGESQYSRGTVARLKAKPSTQQYELVYLSNSSGGIAPPEGDASTLGCGFGLISDGTYIYVAAKQAATSGCGSLTDVTACLNAADLTDATAGSCDTLATSFTIKADPTTLDFNAIPTPSSTETQLHDAIQISNADDVTTAL